MRRDRNTVDSPKTAANGLPLKNRTFDGLPRRKRLPRHDLFHYRDTRIPATAIKQ